MPKEFCFKLSSAFTSTLVSQFFLYFDTSWVTEQIFCRIYLNFVCMIFPWDYIGYTSFTEILQNWCYSLISSFLFIKLSFPTFVINMYFGERYLETIRFWYSSHFQLTDCVVMVSYFIQQSNLLLILDTQISQICQWKIPSNWLVYVCFNMSLIILGASPCFLPHNTLGFVLYFPCPRPGTNHFSKEPWFLLVENGI